MARVLPSFSNRSKVHAPQSPSLQPILDPVRPVLRRKSRMLVWMGTAVTSTGVPLMTMISGQAVDIFVIEVAGGCVADGGEPLRTIGCHPDGVAGGDGVVGFFESIDAVPGEH